MDMDNSRIEELPTLHVKLDWYLYFCMHNDAITSIAVDLTFGTGPMDASLSWLTIVKIDLLAPDGGLAVGTEAEVLDALQEQIEHVANNLRGGFFDRIRRRPPPRFCYVGRVTGEGSRRLYFYGNTVIPAIVYERVLSDARFEPYDIASVELEDPEYATYREDLHPGAALNAIVLGDEQIEMRVQHGDDLDQEREVAHTLWFRTAADRQAFLDLLEQEDQARLFTPDGASVTDLPDEHFEVTLTSMQSVDKLWTNIFVVALSTRAARFNGTYDGWSAPVIQAGTS